MEETKTILIVEQDANLVNGLKSILKKENYSVVSASSHYSLNELFGDNKPDLAIIDIYIPKEFGLNTLRRMEELFPCLPVIAMTVYSNSFSKEELAKYGISYFMAKPFEVKQLIKKIEELIYAKNRLQKEECEKLSL